MNQRRIEHSSSTRRNSPLRGRYDFLRKIGAMVSLFAMLVGVACLYLAGEIYEYQDTVDGIHLPKVDAIVCLAGGRGRIAAAGDVWYHYWELAHEVEQPEVNVPVLYFSGMGRQTNWAALSKQFRRGVLQIIHPEDVIIEKESSNTDTNAKWLAKYARERHWKRILLMTSSYHMKRARYIFGHVLELQQNPVQVETLSVYQEPFAADEWRSDLNGIRVTLVEYLKWIYYQSVWYSSKI